MKKFLFILGLTGCSVCSHAQVDLGKYGQLSGSLESNSIIYVDDKDLPNSVTDTHFGSNNYLKIDYTNQKFSAGFQLEGYFPTLQGYDMGGYDDKHSFILGNKYISWQDKYYGVRAVTSLTSLAADLFSVAMKIGNWDSTTRWKAGRFA